ncbi:hypothetical protein ACHAXS_000572 [Conticribra weissflogii]
MSSSLWCWGDPLVGGIDFFEAHALVFQWTTVCLMLMLEILLDLKSKQADLTAVFLHDTVGKDEKVYVEITFGLLQHRVTAVFLHDTLGKVEKVYVEITFGILQHNSKGKFKFFCLKRTLHIFCQSSCIFWKYLTKKLGICGLT